MRVIIILICLFCFSNILQAQDPIPFREASSYAFELDYNFKTKPPPPKDFISMTDSSPATSEILPYVKVKFNLLTLGDNDYRVKIVSNNGGAVFNKKLKGPIAFDIDMGFAEDIKDRIVPHSYSVYFMDKAKNIHSRITIEVKKDGELLLNQQVYGKL